MKYQWISKYLSTLRILNTKATHNERNRCCRAVFNIPSILISPRNISHSADSLGSHLTAKPTQPRPFWKLYFLLKYFKSLRNTFQQKTHHSIYRMTFRAQTRQFHPDVNKRRHPTSLRSMLTKFKPGVFAYEKSSSYSNQLGILSRLRPSAATTTSIKMWILLSCALHFF